MKPDNYLRPILKRLWKGATEAKQEDLAALLDCDRSRISHQVAGRHALPAHELDVWCDFFDTDELLSAVARRINRKVVPLERTAAASTVIRGLLGVVSAAGKLSQDLAEVLDDDAVDAQEQADMRAALRLLIERAEAALARMPEP